MEFNALFRICLCFKVLNIEKSEDGLEIKGTLITLI
jgi:hypothetical protein